jgi:hypothetical protein
MAGNVAVLTDPVNCCLPKLLHPIWESGYYFFGSPCSTCNRGR